MTVAKRLITATTCSFTAPCVEAARQHIERAGFEVRAFPADGAGGRAMEALIADGLVRGVLDVTTTELAAELVSGTASAGRDRLTAAALHGVPQVISVGGLDLVHFGPPETMPEKFRSRRFHPFSPTLTLMRTTPDENDALGKEIAHKASAARGPTAVLLPLRGLSALDREGQPFYWPEADAVLFQSLRNWMSPHVQVVELDRHINDPEFAQALATTLLPMIRF